eukprot:gene7513-1429_t
MMKKAGFDPAAPVIGQPSAADVQRLMWLRQSATAADAAVPQARE